MKKSKLKKLIALSVGTMITSSAFSVTANAQETSTPRKYVALGDSISVGMSATPGNGYVDLLSTHLKSIDSSLVSTNLSKSGHTSSDLLGVIAANQATLANAEIVTISIGGNDFLQPMVASVNMALKAAFNIDITTQEGRVALAQMMSTDQGKIAVNTALQSFMAQNATTLEATLRANAATLVANYNKIIGSVKALSPEVKIYINNLYNPIIPSSQDPTDPLVILYTMYNNICTNINASLAATSSGNYTVIDTYNLFRNNSNYAKFDFTTFDPHPTTAGHAALANVLKNTVDFKAKSSLVEDKNLMSAINTILNRDVNTPVTHDDLNQLTSLDVSNMGILTLTGLEHATNLTYLNLSGNNITDMSVLSSLPNLSCLEIADLNLEDISFVQSLNSLCMLNISNNRISDISPLKSIEHLYSVNARNQSIPLESASITTANYSIANPLIGYGNNIELSNISNSGQLNGNNIVWNNLTNGTHTLSIDFNETDKLAMPEIMSTKSRAMDEADMGLLVYSGKLTKNLTVELNTSPTITASNVTLTVGDSFDPLKHATAADTEDGNITDKIKVTKNTVDTTKAGVYEVVYEVTDSKGVVTTKEIKVTVIEKEVANTPPTITASDVTITVGDTFNTLKHATAADKEDGNITNKIKVTKNTVNTSKSGVYSVVYKVTDSKGATTTKEIKVTVKSKTTKPTLPQTGEQVGFGFMGLITAALGGVIYKKKK